LGVVTGSRQYPGAAVLTTAAALATGLGMVRFYPDASCADVAMLVMQRSPEVVVAPGRVHAWLLGSGVAPAVGWSWSNALRHRQMASARAQSGPTVLDAGALYLTGTLRAPTLITPHAGELATLLSARGVPVSHQAIAADPQHWAAMAQQTLGVTVLLKGARTVVAGEGVCISLPPSTSWLATAGTGDVLAGIVGALVATWHLELTKQPALMAQLAATSAFIHARAAEVASGGGPLTATALIASIGQVVCELLEIGS
jgi:NAD(P)H-hydrate repair Nnr-like enzyme with NAD(P)H-hydrate dehydratase domain